MYDFSLMLKYGIYANFNLQYAIPVTRKFKKNGIHLVTLTIFKYLKLPYSKDGVKEIHWLLTRYEQISIMCVANRDNLLFQNLYRKLWFLWGDFHPDPLSPEGILKFPEGSTPCPRAGAEARGVYQKARTGEMGIGGNPWSKTRILYMFF